MSLLSPSTTATAPPELVSNPVTGFRYLRNKRCPFSVETFTDEEKVGVERSHCGEWCPLFNVTNYNTVELHCVRNKRGPFTLAVKVP